MPSNRMSTFLRWSRSYREQFGDDRFRRTWRTISDRYPTPGPRISVISFCSDCDRAIVTGGDTFANNITRTFGVACVNCAICPNCCQCDWCNAGAHYTTSDFCTNCSNQNCRECCNCEGRVMSRAAINFFRNKPFFWDANRMQRKMNPTNRYIAAEIEVAEITKDSQILEEKIRRWRGSVVEDGSLPATGFEVNTAPAAGDMYVKQISDICEGLRRAGGDINTKCGLHVHVDARDFDYYDLRRLARVYAAIEPALFKMVPESRRNSRFAKKCGTEYLDAMRWGKYPYSQVKADIVKSLYRIEQIDRENGRGLKKMKKSKYQDARYAALNLHSFFFRGTIECRLFNGTLNADKIINWGVMWAMIMDYVATHDDDTVDRELPLSDTSSFDNLLKMITNDAVRTFAKQRYEQYSKEVETGEKRKRTRPAPPPAPEAPRIRLRADVDGAPIGTVREWREYRSDIDTLAAPVAVGTVAGGVAPMPVAELPRANEEQSEFVRVTDPDGTIRTVQTRIGTFGTPLGSSQFTGEAVEMRSSQLTRENLQQAIDIANEHANRTLIEGSSDWDRFCRTYSEVRGQGEAIAPSAPGVNRNSSSFSETVQALTRALEAGYDRNAVRAAEDAVLHEVNQANLESATPEQMADMATALVGIVGRANGEENND